MWDSPMHLIIIALVLSFLIPVGRIIRRTGHSRWWCLLTFVPLINWIALWIFAYIRWPATDKAS